MESIAVLSQSFNGCSPEFCKRVLWLGRENASCRPTGTMPEGITTDYRYSSAASSELPGYREAYDTASNNTTVMHSLGPVGCQLCLPRHERVALLGNARQMTVLRDASYPTRHHCQGLSVGKKPGGMHQFRPVRQGIGRLQPDHLVEMVPEEV